MGTVEKIFKADIPPRAQYLRVIAMELNRLHSHLLTLGHAGLEIGYETLFQYFWRDREPIMDLIELTSGNRLYGSIMTIGGVRRDITSDQIPKIKTVLSKLRSQCPSMKNLLRAYSSITHERCWRSEQRRTLKLSVTGPVARGSGVDMDVRKINRTHMAKFRLKK